MQTLNPGSIPSVDQILPMVILGKSAKPFVPMGHNIVFSKNNSTRKLRQNFCPLTWELCDGEHAYRTAAKVYRKFIKKNWTSS